jgi:tRNA A37 methylthiotransferase MiaB
MNILIVSFDLQKPEHPVRNLAMGNILSAWRNTAPDASIEHESINILDPAFDLITRVQELFKTREINRQDYIAFAVAIWSESYVLKSVKILQRIGFSGQYIFGGYQITGTVPDSLKATYPENSTFVQGFGESALHHILDSSPNSESNQTVFCFNELSDFPQPYADGSIQLTDSFTSANIETKRGCPYACSYCAHDTVHNRQIFEKWFTHSIEEMALLESHGLKRINIIDPVFNSGRFYMEIAQWISTSARSETQYTVQYKLRDNMHKFLQHCSSGKIHLEIGIQSMDSGVLSNINRSDKPEVTLNKLQEVANFTSSEVSIIYGLPGQTLKSFEDTVNMLQQFRTIKIKAYPLMLLPGTQLYDQRKRWHYEERVDDLGIAYVSKSNSFSETEYQKMEEIALNIN